MTTSAPRLVVAYAAVPAHTLLRSEAARFHGVSTAQVVLAHDCPRCGSETHGRPSLQATAAMRQPAHVSLARAGDLSVVALTEAGPVGVDVEPEGAGDFAGFEDVALHAAERNGASADATRAWVRKEALLKAYGHGLSIDPRDVRLDDAGLAGWHSPHHPPGLVWMRDVVVAGHVVAVAVLLLDDQTAPHLAVTLHPAPS